MKKIMPRLIMVIYLWKTIQDMRRDDVSHRKPHIVGWPGTGFWKFNSTTQSMDF